MMPHKEMHLITIYSCFIHVFKIVLVFKSVLGVLFYFDDTNISHVYRIYFLQDFLLQLLKEFIERFMNTLSQFPRRPFTRILQIHVLVTSASTMQCVSYVREGNKAITSGKRS